MNNKQEALKLEYEHYRHLALAYLLILTAVAFGLIAMQAQFPGDNLASLIGFVALVGILLYIFRFKRITMNAYWKLQKSLKK